MTTMTPTTRKPTPPLHYIPCRVTYVDGARYQIEANGEVRPVLDGAKPAETRTACLPLPEHEAKPIRCEASRQRRNRNRRERDQAMRDLGLVRATGGAFGGWE